MGRRRLRIALWLGLSVLIPLGLILLVLLERGIIAPSASPLAHAVTPAPMRTTAAPASPTTNVLESLEATADSTQVKVGQLALAFGNPFGLQSTMTVGFVSALGRILPVDTGNGDGPSYTIPDIIQTDAPINPGNSGGVLVDDAGRVIGVTSAIISPMGASAGIGFAIPAAIVEKVVPGLIKTGHYTHPWLGVSGISLTPDLTTAMGLNPSNGAVLS